METIDKELQRRVWQRVRGEAGTGCGPDGLLALIAGEWSDSAAYLQLSRHYRGAAAVRLRQMYTQEQSHLACLKGIYTMLTGLPAIVKAPPLPAESRETALRRCYHRELQSLEAFRHWSDHPQFGPVFRHLHEQELEHCRSLLELIGRLSAK